MFVGKVEVFLVYVCCFKEVFVIFSGKKIKKINQEIKIKRRNSFKIK